MGEDLVTVTGDSWSHNVLIQDVEQDEYWSLAVFLLSIGVQHPSPLDVTVQILGKQKRLSMHT